MVKLPFTGAHTKRIYIVDTYLPIEEKIFRFHYALLTFHATNDAPRTTWPRYRRLGLRIDVRKKKKKRKKEKGLWKSVAGGRGTRSRYKYIYIYVGQTYSWQLINIHNVCPARVIHINQPWPIRK